MSVVTWTGPRSLADPDRLRSLAAYQVLDTPGEARFDRITRLVARTLGVEISLVTIADAQRIWYKSRYGTDETVTWLSSVPHGSAFCAEVISHAEPLVVEDARADARFSVHPAVEGGHVAFYLGVPLRTPSGHILGTLCALDHRPREVSPLETELLESLADAVVAELELSRKARLLEQAQDRLVSSLDAIPQGLLIVDHEGCIAHASASACHLLDTPAESLVGAQAMQGLPPEVRSAVAVREDAPEEAVATSADVFFRDRWLSLHRVPFAGGWTLTVEDVTRQHGERRSLQEREEGFRALAENSADVIARYGPDLRLLYINPAIEQATGMPRAELVGRRTRDLPGEQQSARRFEGWLNRVFRTGQPLRKAFSRRTPAGPRDFEITLVPELDARNTVVSVLTTAHDVTERKQVQHRLRMLESVVTHAQDGVVVTDTTLSGEGPRILYVNDAQLRMTGYSAEEVMGRTPRIFQGPDTSPEARACIRAALEAGTAVRQEILNYTREGRPYWVEMFIAPVRDGDGQLTHFISVQHDVTERKQAGELVATANARYEALSRLISAYAFAYRIEEDGTWKTEWTTDTIEDVLGYTAQEVNAHGPAAFLHPDDLDRWHLRNLRLMAGEEVTEEYRIRRSAGDHRWIKVSAFPVRDAAGKVVQVYGAAQDVTDQHEAQVMLTDAKERAEEAARLKDSFLANMSHEIRTPLTGILGFTEILKDEVSGEHQQLVSMIESGGHRLMETLTSVLELSRLQAGRAVMHVEDVDLVRIAVETVGLFAPQARQRGIDISFSLDENVPRAMGDSGAVARVVSNLVNNALKFTDRGTIRVSVRAEGPHVGLHVADSGRGISPEFLPHLFDEFRQESSGLTRSHEGAGLGLAITKRLVDMMGGTISVESERGRGTTFSVRLPLYRSRAEGPASEPPAAESAPAPGARVLVVEDTEATRMFVERTLRREHDVCAVASAQAAMDMARRDETFDVVLLDINLGPGGISGEELMPRLRLSDACRQAHIIAMTAYALPGDRDRFLNAGFDGYLSKPFTRAELTRIVNEAHMPQRQVA
jgi:PAS domain S-box-containing protein